MSVRWVQRAAWVLVGIGVVVAALSVGGLAHPTATGTPPYTSTDTDHGRVVLGFALSMVGAAVLVVSEAFRGRGRGRRIPGDDDVGVGGSGDAGR